VIAIGTSTIYMPRKPNYGYYNTTYVYGWGFPVRITNIYAVDWYGEICNPAEIAVYVW
jgi:hypothetical protein